MGIIYVADRVEEAVVSELGEFSAVLFEANMREMGHSRETLREKDVPHLLERLEADCSKIFREKTPPLSGVVARALANPN